jgi:hypothetical protein
LAVFKRGSDRADCSRKVMLRERFAEFGQFGRLADWKLRIPGRQDHGHIGLLGPDRVGLLGARHPRHKLISNHEVDCSASAENAKACSPEVAYTTSWPRSSSMAAVFTKTRLSSLSFLNFRLSGRFFLERSMLPRNNDDRRSRKKSLRSKVANLP